ncbi:MAG TPA: response regulator [Anaeromyxobacteraceae bacterium]|nr:response regulator [Anaeromyxobacteraceae bacterium]
MARRWDRPEEHDDLLLLVDPDDAHRQHVFPHLSALAGKRRVDVLGRYPRYRIVTAEDGVTALERAEPGTTVAAVDLVLPRLDGLDLVRRLRERFPDAAILAFGALAPPSEAVAAVMAGADYFLELREGAAAKAFERALDLALDRRRLARVIERSEAESEWARGRLTQISGELGRMLPRAARSLEPRDLLPFDEAARRYLAAAARLFEGEAPELARRLGVSYFALRRLLARYDVPFPKRTRLPDRR